METQFQKNDLTFDEYAIESSNTSGNEYPLKSLSREDVVSLFIEKIDAFKIFFQQHRIPGLPDLFAKIGTLTGKKSFLVFTHNKYITIPTENIAFFYVKHESSTIVCFDRQEYTVNHSLDKIQNLVSEIQFFRINRQFLVNFQSIKEVEHYFARKLLVNLTVPVREKLLVSKAKVSIFLNWLENR